VSYWEAQPARWLRAWVARVSGSRDEAPQTDPIRVLPDGGTDLLFERELETGACRALVFGAKSTALVVADPRPMYKIAVHLRPGAGGMFGVPASELCDRVFPLEELCHGVDVEPLFDLAELHSAQALRRIEAVLARASERSPRRTDLARLARHATRRIAASGGREPIAHVARELGVSSRTLERAFCEHVGPSPKRFARIERLGVAHRALLSGAPCAQVASLAGYSDQAHMVREFTRLAGVSPLRAARPMARA
jgi:AraC-like DNA-binding protein